MRRGRVAATIAANEANEENILAAAFVYKSPDSRARATLNATGVDNCVDGRSTGVEKFIATGINRTVGDRATTKDIFEVAADRRPDAGAPDI